MKIRILSLVLPFLFCFGEARAAPGRVSTLTATNISDTSVTLKWKVPNSSRPITNVDLRISTNNITSANWSKKTRIDYVRQSGAIGTTQTVVIYGLSRASTNYFGIKLQDSQGSFSMLATLRVRTSASEYGSVTLEWDPSPDSWVAGYAIHYGTTSSNYTVRIDVGNNTSCRITNLTRGATYYFVATAYTSDGQESLPSNEVAYTVPGGSDGASLLERKYERFCFYRRFFRPIFSLADLNRR